MHQKITSYAIIETVSSREKPSRMFLCINNPRKRGLIRIRCGR
jgi:hypothetical protein